MNASVSFPLFVFKRDDYSMFVVETPHEVLYHMDPLDLRMTSICTGTQTAGPCKSLSLTNG